MTQQARSEIAEMSDRAVAVAAFKITMRLFLFVDRLLFWLLHLLLAVVVMVVAWWFQITPAHVAAAASTLWGSAFSQALQAAGLSLALLLGVYLAAARWVWNRTAWPWLKRQVLKGA